MSLFHLGYDAPQVRQSAARLSRDRDAFTRQFHYEVTRLVPDLAGPQAPDMWAFCERMAQTLLWVALTDQPLGVVADTLRRVGALNWAEGFPEAQYASVAHALVQTVHYLSDSDWSASMGSTWISYFMWIKPHLLAGAEQAAAEHAAAAGGLSEAPWSPGSRGPRRQAGRCLTPMAPCRGNPGPAPAARPRPAGSRRTRRRPRRRRPARVPR